MRFLPRRFLCFLVFLVHSAFTPFTARATTDCSLMKGKIQYPIWLLPVLFPATFCSRTAVTRKPPGSSTERLLAEATQRVPTVGILRRVPHRKTNRCSLHVEAQSCLSADRKDNRIKGIPVPFLPSGPSYEPGKIPLPRPKLYAVRYFYV